MQAPSKAAEASSVTTRSAAVDNSANIAAKQAHGSTRNEPIDSVTGAQKEEKTEAQKEADRKYEERIEDEYAKREGGA
ncbi:MAG: hypothetical protein M1815_004066 [Lichina confinis]|nr:MAG: hypothetical protein M1815_004066 [Lichina confinis]